MSKNMTRKGLALGAGFALVASSFAALPASATGIDNGAVRLTPNAGTTYNMLAKETFDLKANFANSAQSGGDLKFLIEATTGSVKYDVDVNGLTTADTGYVLARPITSATVNDNGTDPEIITVVATAHGFSTGDRVKFGGTFAAAGGNAKDFTAAGYAETTVTVVDANTFTFAVGTNGDASGAVTATSATATFVASAVSAASVSGNVLSVTVANGRHYMVGDLITVSGVTLSAGTSGAANQDHTITSISGNVLTAALTNANASSTLSSAKAVLKTPATNTSLSSRTVITGAPLGEGRVTGATPGYVSGTNKFVVDTNDATAGGPDAVLRLVATDATVTTSAKVTAWIDDNDNGLIDSTEFQSPARTVTFLPNSAVTFTTAFEKPLLAATSLTAAVTIAPDINLAQIPDGTVAVDFLLNAGAIGASDVAANWDADEAALLAVDSALVNVDGAGGTAVVAGVYSAQADYDALNRGAIVYQTVVSATKDIAAVAEAVTAPSANTAGLKIKTGTGSVTFSTTVTEWGAYGSPSTAVAASAGIPAKVTIARSVLASASTVTAGGKTLKATGASSITFDAVTNADGKVVFDIAATGAKNDAITITVSVEDLDTNATPTSAPSPAVNGFKSNSGATFVWEDAVATSLVDATTLGGSAQRAIAKGGTATLSYDLVDQFGQPIAAERRYVFALTGTTAGQVEASVQQYVVSSTGSASVTVTDVSTALTGSYTLGVTVEKKNLAGNWVAETGTASTVLVMGGKAVSSVTTSTAMTSVDTRKTLQTVAMVAHDGRKAALAAFPYTSAGAGDYFTITGTVKAADGSGVAGQAVTISAAGAGFATANSGTTATWATDSITVYTTSTGAYTVYAYSNKSGSVVYSVASGSATATTTGIFAYPAITAGTSLVIDAPASAQPGSTFKVTATLTDKYGNAVYTNSTTTNDQIAITYDGPGIVVATLPDDTDTKGQVSFAVLLGSNDSGTATITVAYDQSNNGNFTGTTALDKDIVVSKSVVVGVAGNVGEYSSWTKKLDDNSAKIYAKNVVGAGKVQFFLNGREIAWVRATSASDSKLRTANGSAYLVRTVEFAAGKNVLEVYVDGVRTTRTAYTK